MSIDLRVKHDLESRRRAVELFDAGVGCKPAAEALSVPRETVREWQWVYRAFGSEALVSVSVNLFFTSFAKQARRSRKGGFTGCANVISPIPVTT